MAPLALDLFDDQGLTPPVAETVRRIAIVGFAELWRGQSPDLAELVTTDPATLAAATDHLLGRGRMELSEDGRVLGVHGLCLRPTPHHIRHARGAVHTWCALDVIGIPAALSIDAHASTRCPTCASGIGVAFTRGQPDDDDATRLWYPQAPGGHLVADFCSGANLFCSQRHLEECVGRADTAGTVMTVEEVAELGRECWSAAARHLASPQTEPTP